MGIFSHVKIIIMFSAHMVFRWCLYNKVIYCSSCHILNCVTLDDFSLNSVFEKLTFEVECFNTYKYMKYLQSLQTKLFFN